MDQRKCRLCGATIVNMPYTESIVAYYKTGLTDEVHFVWVDRDPAAVLSSGVIQRGFVIHDCRKEEDK